MIIQAEQWENYISLTAYKISVLLVQLDSDTISMLTLIYQSHL
jgi:hypothetical protein